MFLTTHCKNNENKKNKQYINRPQVSILKLLYKANTND
ncbi:hypothetical protein NAMH_1203 [Nautilia profundicola AmH]|uniref:Uncharacterized protein n=1 Tax=Nautilia profundicola (strain ATCC BAA-1463 / DSM 18972 / AmH) TaxID=598659 RepID=B9LAD9_NAUPA|nr:hypothetical protein NAMH_1203 [Nautilia profundicola AmH]